MKQLNKPLNDLGADTPQQMTWQQYKNLYKILGSNNLDDLIMSLMCLDSFTKTYQFRIFASCLWRLLLARAVYERDNYGDKAKLLPVELFKDFCPITWDLIKVNSVTNTLIGPPVDGILDTGGVSLVGKESISDKFNPTIEYNFVKSLLSEKGDIHNTE